MRYSSNASDEMFINTKKVQSEARSKKRELERRFTTQQFRNKGDSHNDRDAVDTPADFDAIRAADELAASLEAIGLDLRGNSFYSINERRSSLNDRYGVVKVRSDESYSPRKVGRQPSNNHPSRALTESIPRMISRSKKEMVEALDDDPSSSSSDDYTDTSGSSQSEDEIDRIESLACYSSMFQSSQSSDDSFTEPVKKSHDEKPNPPRVVWNLVGDQNSPSKKITFDIRRDDPKSNHPKRSKMHVADESRDDSNPRRGKKEVTKGATSLDKKSVDQRTKGSTRNILNVKKRKSLAVKNPDRTGKGTENNSEKSKSSPRRHSKEKVKISKRQSLDDKGYPETHQSTIISSRRQRDAPYKQTERNELDHSARKRSNRLHSRMHDEQNQEDEKQRGVKRLDDNFELKVHTQEVEKHGWRKSSNRNDEIPNPLEHSRDSDVNSDSLNRSEQQQISRWLSRKSSRRKSRDPSLTSFKRNAQASSTQHGQSIHYSTKSSGIEQSYDSRWRFKRKGLSHQRDEQQDGKRIMSGASESGNSGHQPNLKSQRKLLHEGSRVKHRDSKRIRNLDDEKDLIDKRYKKSISAYHAEEIGKSRSKSSELKTYRNRTSSNESRKRQGKSSKYSSPESTKSPSRTPESVRLESGGHGRARSSESRRSKSRDQSSPKYRSKLGRENSEGRLSSKSLDGSRRNSRSRSESSRSKSRDKSVELSRQNLQRSRSHASIQSSEKKSNKSIDNSSERHGKSSSERYHRTSDDQYLERRRSKSRDRLNVDNPSERSDRFAERSRSKERAQSSEIQQKTNEESSGKRRSTTDGHSMERSESGVQTVKKSSRRTRSGSFDGNSYEIEESSVRNNQNKQSSEGLLKNLKLGTNKNSRIRKGTIALGREEKKQSIANSSGSKLDKCSNGTMKTAHVSCSGTEKNAAQKPSEASIENPNERSITPKLDQDNEVVPIISEKVKNTGRRSKLEVFKRNKNQLQRVASSGTSHKDIDKENTSFTAHHMTKSKNLKGVLASDGVECRNGKPKFWFSSRSKKSIELKGDNSEVQTQDDTEKKTISEDTFVNTDSFPKGGSSESPANAHSDGELRGGDFWMDNFGLMMCTVAGAGLQVLSTFSVLPCSPITKLFDKDSIEKGLPPVNLSNASGFRALTYDNIYSLADDTTTVRSETTIWTNRVDAKDIVKDGSRTSSTVDETKKLVEVPNHRFFRPRIKRRDESQTHDLSRKWPRLHLSVSKFKKRENLLNKNEKNKIEKPVEEETKDCPSKIECNFSKELIQDSSFDEQNVETHDSLVDRARDPTFVSGFRGNEVVEKTDDGAYGIIDCKCNNTNDASIDKVLGRLFPRMCKSMIIEDKRTAERLNILNQIEGTRKSTDETGDAAFSIAISNEGAKIEGENDENRNALSAGQEFTLAEYQLHKRHEEKSASSIVAAKRLATQKAATKPSLVKGTITHQLENRIGELKIQKRLQPHNNASKDTAVENSEGLWAQNKNHTQNVHLGKSKNKLAACTIPTDRYTGNEHAKVTSRIKTTATREKQNTKSKENDTPFVAEKNAHWQIAERKKDENEVAVKLTRKEDARDGARKTGRQGQQHDPSVYAGRKENEESCGNKNRLNENFIGEVSDNCEEKMERNDNSFPHHSQGQPQQKLEMNQSIPVSISNSSMHINEGQEATEIEVIKCDTLEEVEVSESTLVHKTNEVPTSSFLQGSMVTSPHEEDSSVIVANYQQVQMQTYPRIQDNPESLPDEEEKEKMIRKESIQQESDSQTDAASLAFVIQVPIIHESSSFDIVPNELEFVDPEESNPTLSITSFSKGQSIVDQLCKKETEVERSFAVQDTILSDQHGRPKKAFMIGSSESSSERIEVIHGESDNFSNHIQGKAKSNEALDRLNVESEGTDQQILCMPETGTIHKAGCNDYNGSHNSVQRVKKRAIIFGFRSPFFHQRNSDAAYVADSRKILIPHVQDEVEKEEPMTSCKSHNTGKISTFLRGTKLPESEVYTGTNNYLDYPGKVMNSHVVESKVVDEVSAQELSNEADGSGIDINRENTCHSANSIEKQNKALPRESTFPSKVIQDRDEIEICLSHLGQRERSKSHICENSDSSMKEERSNIAREHRSLGKVMTYLKTSFRKKSTLDRCCEKDVHLVSHNLSREIMQDNDPSITPSTAFVTEDMDEELSGRTSSKNSPNRVFFSDRLLASNHVGTEEGNSHKKLPLLSISNASTMSMESQLSESNSNEEGEINCNCMHELWQLSLCKGNSSPEEAAMSSSSESVTALPIVQENNFESVELFAINESSPDISGMKILRVGSNYVLHDSNLVLRKPNESATDSDIKGKRDNEENVTSVEKSDGAKKITSQFNDDVLINSSLSPSGTDKTSVNHGIIGRFVGQRVGQKLRKKKIAPLSDSNSRYQGQSVGEFEKKRLSISLNNALGEKVIGKNDIGVNEMPQNAPIHDVKEAVNVIRQHAALLGVSEKRFVLFLMDENSTTADAENDK